MNKLKEDYKNACENYINVFCEKQELQFDGFVGGVIGEIVMCSDYFFNLSDIIIDVDTKQPEGNIQEWYWCTLGSSKEFINYRNWIMGSHKSKLNYKT